ncbi:UNVERIFIED_CONTAM: hypothetical protein FKN15_055355 [Acipenser sinensis]
MVINLSLRAKFHCLAAGLYRDDAVAGHKPSLRTALPYLIPPAISRICNELSGCYVSPSALWSAPVFASDISSSGGSSI